MLFENMIAKKGDIEIDTLIPWIIGIAVLAVLLVLYGVLNDKGGGAISFLKNLIKFG